MGKFRTGLGFGVAIVGAYLLAERFYPEKTAEGKAELKKHCDTVKEELLSIKDSTISKTQDFADVAGIASEETKEHFAHTQQEVVKSLKSLSEKVGKVVAETKSNLQDKDDKDQVVDTLVKGVKEVKDELTHSFEEILNTFSSLKEEVQSTADTALELSEEVVAE